ncbi:MAG: hypothetical protein LCH61_01260 [Proteobacteria bacterium]|nr:hypothetical protein [Pseudomonadota bacterium]MCA0421947.1 hypothetical protein [Pseudomonadota bacterium]
MATNKKPASLRPAGFGGLDEYSTSRLTQKIANFQREVELADPDVLRQKGVEAFRRQIEQETENRALAIALFGAERCAGCRFFQPRDGYYAGLCRRTSSKLHKPADTRATEWCGRHEVIEGAR